MNNSLQVNHYSGSDGKQQVARVFNMSTQIFTAPANVIIQQNCFGFMFTNVGDVKAFVNGMVINPSATPTTAIGDSRSIMAHQLDIYKGNITLSFDSPTTGTAPKVEIVQLYYAESYI